MLALFLGVGSGYDSKLGEGCTVLCDVVVLESLVSGVVPVLPEAVVLPEVLRRKRREGRPREKRAIGKLRSQQSQFASMKIILLSSLSLSGFYKTEESRACGSRLTHARSCCVVASLCFPSGYPGLVHAHAAAALEKSKASSIEVSHARGVQ